MVRVDLSGLWNYTASFMRGRIGSREDRYQARLIRRYVGLGGRYLHLRGGVLAWPRSRQWLFQYRLRWSARRATRGDLTTLLDSGWREHLAASWLIAVGRRADLRDRIAQELLGDAPCGYGWDYCTALARLGTDQDAGLLRRYLDQALLLPCPVDESDDWQCQRHAMGTLLYLDGVLGASYAQPLLAPGGLWERWSGDEGTDSLETVRENVAQLVAFAAGKDPLVGAQAR
ncbi:hypothetical protein IPZ58_15735 [Streptomyces roseoverticillatus]|uniref:DUF6000 family protein n=1 Tax=Streptomyces roseoverticillatus TaxID=66429 RepID=UPI001F3F96BE|nr:DUF6000 family protein [Streptomyces roseoverticillatus]MCF3103027.1 hypothetical protein [Streptomyces roseoverticillatus]